MPKEDLKRVLNELKIIRERMRTLAERRKKFSFPKTSRVGSKHIKNKQLRYRIEKLKKLKRMDRKRDFI